MNARSVIEAETPKQVLRSVERISDNDLSTALEMSGFENNAARWIYGRYAPGKRYLNVSRHALWAGSGVLRQAEEDPQPVRARPYDLWSIKVLQAPQRRPEGTWAIVAQFSDLRSAQVPKILADYGIQLKRWTPGQ